MLGKVFVLYHKFISHPRGTFTWTPHLSVHDNAFMLLRHCFSGRSQHMMVNQTVLDLAPLLSGDSRISLMADTCVQLHQQFIFSASLTLVISVLMTPRFM